MSTRPIFNDEQQLRDLRQLYGDVPASAIADGIDSLLQKYGDIGGVDASKRPLDERDVLLITYGDTLTEKGTAPLKVLQRLHEECLRGV